jgi:hypothetical protein
MIIEKFINEITKSKEYDYEKNYEYDDWSFYGDGQGDWENIGNDTTIECLDKYIIHCEKQIELAKEYKKYLKEKK